MYRYDVGPDVGSIADVIFNPLDTFSGNIWERETSTRKLFYGAITTKKVASLTEIGARIWKAYVLSMPASCEYSLLGGPNCISWTIKASAFAKAIARTEKSIK